MYATYLIIAITCVISFLAFRNEKLISDLILWPPAISRGKQYYRLISYGFIHADGQHLLFNMITLFFFGRLIEQFVMGYVGTLGFAAFYLSAIVVSILPTYMKNIGNPAYRSLGASGAVSAVLFGFVLLQPWTTIYIFFIPCPAIVYAVVYIAYSIYMDRQNSDNINHSAHLWGAAYGVLFLLAMEPRLFGVFLQSLMQPDFR
ncbi:MAG: rhomboid family intramembrane serine protease [Xanthomonadales bacterium]|uniref:rhomboid family intramembrane serine protease n=1 Tax=Dokdonella sp. TaxID=2291710 RepID=UPI002D025F29|nr:rhomboid family intramembrane serine protease [Xanthomonadales bacterium]HQV73243.1 rhomboid family intramembrane serine protease [Dokdonella sp.]MBK7013121.1 rhomboid family intramembrane serine protease [Xanthomonadales bacterium]MBK7208907.1 rhomboid family intramembrane serine protease [Xanthomonadales bacterium]MBL0221936.1 rhomboid family intramembrane serine protease [Xanthomonadales bacterium]